MLGVVVSLFVAGSGTSFLVAGLEPSPGNFIHSTNDNQVINALTWQEYKINPWRGTCTIYEDFSLSGTCVENAVDPDGDDVLDGTYRSYTPVQVYY